MKERTGRGVLDMKKRFYPTVFVLIIIFSVLVPTLGSVNAEEEPGKGVIFFNSAEGAASATYTSINKGVPIELTAEIVNTGEANVKDLTAESRDINKSLHVKEFLFFLEP
ncbi:MAG: hypothetical protein ACMUHM_06615, partial [Thermoplasmatota archaeon]